VNLRVDHSTPELHSPAEAVYHATSPAMSCWVAFFYLDVHPIYKVGNHLIAQLYMGYIYILYGIYYDIAQ
jgi:hypothetical protein